MYVGVHLSVSVCVVNHGHCNQFNAHRSPQFRFSEERNYERKQLHCDTRGCTQCARENSTGAKEPSVGSARGLRPAGGKGTPAPDHGSCSYRQLTGP